MHKVYTLGYTGLKPATILRLVEEYEAFLIDIRYSPRSRVPHWNRAALREMLPGRYLWVQQLGNVNYNSDDPVRLFDPEAAVRGMPSLLEQRSAILLCACKDWRFCHRRQAAELLAARLGVAVEHLQIRA